MEKRLCYLTRGGDAVITRAKKAPRLQTLGLTPGKTVHCKYKSGCIMVLEVEKRLLALRIRDLKWVWADF